MKLLIKTFFIGVGLVLILVSVVALFLSTGALNVGKAPDNIKELAWSLCVSVAVFFWSIAGLRVSNLILEAAAKLNRTVIHDVIFEELVRGIIRPESKQRYLEAIGRLRAQGAAGVIAGCTEIELLVDARDLDCPYFPTTRLHALAAVDFALGGGGEE